MKTAITVLTYVCLVVLITAVYFEQKAEHEKIIEHIHRVEQLYQHRTYIDSLYWKHLEKCSFIDEEKIQVGYDRYLRLRDDK